MKNSNKAFTLIELLVVVLIIGILAAVAVPQYQKAVDKARYTELMSLVKNIKVQQELYFLANGEYATSCKELALDIPTNTTLEDSGIIMENKGKFKINCFRGNTRAAGIMLDEQGKNLLSYEMYFRHIEPDQDGINWANRIDCWGNDRFANVCKSLCVGEWITLTENQGYCNIGHL